MLEHRGFNGFGVPCSAMGTGECGAPRLWPSPIFFSSSCARLYLASCGVWHRGISLHAVSCRVLSYRVWYGAVR
jgi:hypothetical protein